MDIIVIGNRYEKEHLDMIKEAASEAGSQLHIFDTEDDAIASGISADIIYGIAPRIAATDGNLKWLCTPTAGVDYLMRDGAFANRECILTNAAGAYGVTIAEHMIGVLIMMMRRIPEFQEGTAQRKWYPPRSQKLILGSRITVLGAGDIGRSFAERIRSFKPACITAISRSGRSECSFFDEICPVSRLDEILPRTDVLAMSLPATEETKDILSRERLSLLPDGAYIINVGRGSAIDEDAIADELDSGRLAGAALDVFRTEPLPEDSRLWNTRNLLITPHVAGNLTADHTIERNVEMFCEDLDNYASGRQLRYLVDRSLGY